MAARGSSRIDTCSAPTAIRMGACPSGTITPSCRPMSGARFSASSSSPARTDDLRLAAIGPSDLRRDAGTALACPLSPAGCRIASTRLVRIAEPDAAATAAPVAGHLVLAHAEAPRHRPGAKIDETARRRGRARAQMGNASRAALSASSSEPIAAFLKARPVQFRRPTSQFWAGAAVLPDDLHEFLSRQGISRGFGEIPRRRPEKTRSIA